MRSWILLPWVLLETACVFFDHADEGSGGAQGGTQSSSGDTTGSTGGSGGSGGAGGSGASGPAGGSGGGGGCFTPPMPTPVVLKDCTTKDHLGGDSHMCVVARVISQSLTGPIPGAVALTDRSVFFAVADTSCSLPGEETRIYQFDKNEIPSNVPTVIRPSRCLADNAAQGTMTATRIGPKDHVFFAGQAQHEIQRCPFGLPVESCRTFRMSPDEIQANGPAVIPACHPELMWALPTAVGEAVFFSAPIEDNLMAPPTPRFQVNPAVAGGEGGRFVKVFGPRVALGVHKSENGDGSAYVIETSKALPPEKEVLSSRYQANGLLTGLALNSTHTYLRSLNSVVVDTNNRRIPGDGPIAADDSFVIVAQCPLGNSCTLAKSTDVTLSMANAIGPPFEKVGDIISDGQAFYFTAVLSGDGMSNLVSLVRYTK